MKTILKAYRQSDIETQLKAKSVLLSNAVMIVIAFVFLPFTFDETPLLPISLIAAAAGFAVSIVLLHYGRLAHASLIHIAITTMIASFLHLYVSNSYTDALTFLVITIILITDALLVATHRLQILLLFSVSLFSMAAAPYLKIGGDLSLSLDLQLENIVLLTVSFALLYFIYKDSKGLVSALGKETDRVKEREEHLARLNQRLAENEKKFRSYVEFSPIPIAITDEDGNIVFLSRSFSEVFGYTTEELTHLDDWWPLAYPDHDYREATMKAWTSEVESSVAGEVEINPMERIVTCKDGTQKHIEFRHRPIGDLGITLFNDNTERRRVEQQMQHTQKLESLGVLAGGIAHDFNNLLMGILGNADLAKANLPPENPAYSYLTSIERSSRRAAELTNQLLAYSGKGHFVIEELNLNVMVKEMGHLLKAAISKKVTLRYRMDDDLSLISGDATQIRQVVMNLITNASDAIGDKIGTIHIATGELWVDSLFLQESYLDESITEGQYTYFEVSDSGCGMSQDTIQKIFDPFFTTKFSGRGLGLAAVQGIVRGHKGMIKVDSELEKGTSIKVLFPSLEKKTPHTQTQREPMAAKETLITEDKVILVVDDDTVVRDVASAMLEQLGFNCLTAVDGIDALQVLDRDNDIIRLVILDMTMPRMDGEETFREIRQRYPDMKVLLASGYNEVEATSHFVGDGLAGFVQKPFAMDQLMQKISEVLSG